jgi:hypothetical protein
MYLRPSLWHRLKRGRAHAEPLRQQGLIGGRGKYRPVAIVRNIDAQVVMKPRHLVARKFEPSDLEKIVAA